MNKLKKTWNNFANSPLLLLYSLLSDISFLAVYTFAGNIFAELIGNRIASISPLLTKNIALYGISAVLSKDALLILFFIILGLFVSYLIYIFFQGLAWWIAFKIANQKIACFNYMKSFAKVNLFWLLAYSLYSINDFMLAFRIKLAPDELMPAKYILLILLFIVVLMAVPSYVFLNIKKALDFLSSNFLSALQTYVFIFIILFAIDRFLVILRFNAELQLFAGLILVFLGFAFSRVFLIQSFKNKLFF